jgi:hypothetical protein
MNALDDTGGSRGAAMGLITALVSAGVISIASGQLWTLILGMVPGALAMAATIVGGYGVVKRGEPLVTPIEDPAACLDGELVSLVPAPRRSPLPPPAIYPDPPIAP